MVLIWMMLVRVGGIRLKRYYLNSLNRRLKSKIALVLYADFLMFKTSYIRTFQSWLANF